MPFFTQLLQRLARLERAVTLLAFVVLITVVFADVVSRELTGTGLHWARQIGVWANFIVVMFGLGLASTAGQHLRPRFADDWLPDRWSPLMDRLQDAGMALFCLGFAVVALQMTLEGLALQERSAVLGVLVWPVQAVIPLVFVLAAIRHGIYCLYPALRPAAPDVGNTPARSDRTGF